MAQQKFNPLSKQIFETAYLRKLKKIVIHNPLEDVINTGNFNKANITSKGYAEYTREVKNVKFLLKVDKKTLEKKNSFKVVWYNTGLGKNAHCELVCHTDSNKVIYPKVWEDTDKSDIVGIFDKVVNNIKKFKKK